MEEDGPIPTPQPIHSRPMFSSYGRSLEKSSVTFVSNEALKQQSLSDANIYKDLLPVENTRKISKKDMVFNDACPKIEVNPETYEVKANGDLLTCEPAKELPLAQRYFMY